jgi:riboflavin synthase
MFSGIVEALGKIAEIRSEPPGCRLIVSEPKIALDTTVADSISVNGCCLTVVETDDETMGFQAGPETLARTNLGDLRPDSPVNLERALAVGDRLGGHFVSGHIDAVGHLLERRDHGEWSDFWFSVPRNLAVQMASKGSIAVDGVSLTIVDSHPERFSVALIPYTLAVTTLGSLKAGDKVNLETDILAKYVQRLNEARDWDFGEMGEGGRRKAEGGG